MSKAASRFETVHHMSAQEPPSDAGDRPAGFRQPINRRHFLAAGAGCLCGAVAGAAPAAKSRWPLVEVGPLKGFAKDEISDAFAKHDFLLIRHQGTLIAASTVCPHRGNTLGRDPQDGTRMVCDGHGSVFDSEGLVVIGPATSGLVRLGISVNAQGQVVVDRNVEFPQDRWNDKGSSIKCK